MVDTKFYDKQNPHNVMICFSEIRENKKIGNKYNPCLTFYSCGIKKWYWVIKLSNVYQTR